MNPRPLSLVLKFILGLFSAQTTLAQSPQELLSPGYQKIPTGDMSEFSCLSLKGENVPIYELGRKKVQAQIRSFLDYNPEFKRCHEVAGYFVISGRRPDYVDGIGGISRFFLFEGKISCPRSFWGRARIEHTIYRLVQHYSHPFDPSQNKCL